MVVKGLTTRLHHTLLTFVLYVLVIAGAVLIPTTPAIASDFDEAVALHDAVRDGDSKRLDDAVTLLQTLHAEQPQNAEILAYLGSVYAILAREGRSVVSKMRDTNRALRELDRAAEIAPNNFTVRMVRANVQMNLPQMFGREDDAIDDMIMLHSIFAQSPTRTHRMAEAMVPIYDSLIERAPDRADWASARQAALQIAQ